MCSHAFNLGYRIMMRGRHEEKGMDGDYNMEAKWVRPVDHREVMGQSVVGWAG